MTKADGLVAGVIVVLLAGLAFMFFSADTVSRGNDLRYAPIDIPGAQILEAYAVSSEVMNVVVDIPVASWVTVHVAIGEAPGPVIGQSEYIAPGKRTASMSINPLMVSGMTYIVLVHNDDSDGLFDINKDLPISVDGTVLRADVIAP